MQNGQHHKYGSPQRNSSESMPDVFSPEPFVDSLSGNFYQVFEVSWWLNGHEVWGSNPVGDGLCWGVTDESTLWGHVERGQFTYSHFYWAGIVF